MRPLSGQLIVRRVAPYRAWLVALLALALLALAMWLSFDFGRDVAGFSSNDARGERAQLVQQVAALEAQVRELRVQLAGADSVQLSQQRERSEVARTIGELQGQLDVAQRDLQFYRGIANPKSLNSTAILVQQFSVQAVAADPRRFLLRLALARESRKEDLVGGTVVAVVEGNNAGAPARVEAGKWPFSFRYFSKIEQPVTLPTGFVAERVTLEVRASTAGMAPYQKTFVWSPVNQE
jgi:hypothetical protein